MRSKANGIGSSTLPMCAWGDGNTGALVAVVTAETALQDPEEVDLAEAARQAAQVRKEMREPIGAGDGGLTAPGGRYSETSMIFPSLSRLCSFQYVHHLSSTCFGTLPSG